MARRIRAAAAVLLGILWASGCAPRQTVGDNAAEAGTGESVAVASASPQPASEIPSKEGATHEGAAAEASGGAAEAGAEETSPSAESGATTGESTGQPPSSGEGATAETGAGEKRILLAIVKTDVELLEDGKHRVWAIAKAPAPGWRAVLLPRAGGEALEDTREYDLAGIPPDSATPQASGGPVEVRAERIETFPEEVRAVFIHGKDDVVAVEEVPRPGLKPGEAPEESGEAEESGEDAESGGEEGSTSE